VLTLNSTTGVSFDQCSAASGPYYPASCPVYVDEFPGVVGVGSFGPVSFTVSAAAGAGGGVSPSGNDNAYLFVTYDYTSGAPEPTTLVLMGGALLGLGVFGSKKLSRR
jgi:hypothetical protein